MGVRRPPPVPRRPGGRGVRGRAVVREGRGRSPGRARPHRQRARRDRAGGQGGRSIDDVPRCDRTLATAGSGRTNRLDGVRILSCCDWEAAGRVGPDEFPPSFVDMAGPGGRPDTLRGVDQRGRHVHAEADVDLREADRAVRRASLRVARDVAAATIGAEPDVVEVKTLAPRRHPSSPPSAPSCRSHRRARCWIPTSMGCRPTGSCRR